MAQNKTMWLAKLLMTHGALTKDQILEHWRKEDEYGQRMAVSTFYDKKRQLNDLFEICLRLEGGRYRLEMTRQGKQSMELIEHMLQGGKYWMDEPLPTGFQWIKMLEKAIQSHRMVEMRYEPYDKPGYALSLCPYLLRIFKGCCYVVGHSSKHGEIRIFGLDRASSVALRDEHFTTNFSFDIRAYFRHSFGVFGSLGQQPAHVVFETSARTAPYLRRRPLHASQKDSETETGKVRFELDVCVTCDFVRELFSYGSQLRVIEPAMLREHLLQEAKAVVALNSDSA